MNPAKFINLLNKYLLCIYYLPDVSRVIVLHQLCARGPIACCIKTCSQLPPLPPPPHPGPHPNKPGSDELCLSPSCLFFWPIALLAFLKACWH